MPADLLDLDGVKIPRLLYGTAWKEDATQRLTEQALECGFRGIDTANQRRHYDEAAVGRAVQAAIARGLVSRDDLFLQTKFTFQHGQDHRLPYDPQSPIATQVEQSVASSLDHLGVQQHDSFLLHGPSQRIGLSPDDWEAWRAIEAIHTQRKARLIGVSNFTRAQLEELCGGARVQPRLVQNRCYAARGWDRDVREFCRDRGILYQGFSLLTANRAEFSRPEIAAIARRHGRTIPQVIFRFAMDVGMLPLTGTTSADHMREDLAAADLRLSPVEIELIEGTSTEA